MLAIINNDNSVFSLINSQNALPQYIAIKDFPFDFDKKINSSDFISYLKHNFTNTSSEKRNIFRCESSISSQMFRFFSKDGEDFFKICGDQYEKEIKGNKIIYFSENHIYNLLYLKLNNNQLDVKKHKTPKVKLNEKYNLLYSLYFMDEKTAKLIQNNNKYSSILKYRYRSKNMLPVYEAIFIDEGKHFLNYFKDNPCEIVELVLQKTCFERNSMLALQMYGNSSSTQFICQEKIVHYTCTDLKSLNLLLSKPLIKNNMQKYSSNYDVSEVRLDHSGALVGLIFTICSLVVGLLLGMICIYRKYRSCIKLPSREGQGDGGEYSAISVFDDNSQNTIGKYTVIRASDDKICSQTVDGDGEAKILFASVEQLQIENSITT